MSKRISSILIITLTVFTFFSCNKKYAATDAVPQKVIKRIVSLGPSATEILFAIGAGDKVVARTAFCDYPEEVSKLPSVGGFSSASENLESIISYKPDMVYLFAGMHDSFIKPLEDLGITVYVSDAASIKAVEDEILAVGKLTGCEVKAEEVVKQMNAELSEIKAKVTEAKNKSERKEYKMFWQLWDDPLMTAGKNSYINDIIEAAGWINIFGDVEQAYPVVSAEAVISAKPNYVIMTGSSEISGAFSNVVFDKEYIELLHEQDDFWGAAYMENSEITRPSPRVVNTVKEFADMMISYSKK